MATKPQFEIIRDKYGFLKCEGCPRRFLTQIGFENHSHNQQKKDTKTEPDELQQSQTEKHGSSQNKIDHLSKSHSFNITLTLFT